MKRLIHLATLAVFAISAQPATAQTVDFVVAKIRTGGDDLRGNDDNAFVTVWSFREDGRQRGVVRQVNTGNQRIGDYVTQTVSIPMPEGTELSDITAFHLDVRGFTGGFDGDNWNVDAIYLTAENRGRVVSVLMNEFASPLIRFTGDNQFFSRRFQ